MEQLLTGISFIRSCHQEGEKVFTHCRKGQVRCVMLAAAHNMLSRGLSPERAGEEILSKVPRSKLRRKHRYAVDPNSSCPLRPSYCNICCSLRCSCRCSSHCSSRCSSRACGKITLWKVCLMSSTTLNCPSTSTSMSKHVRIRTFECSPLWLLLLLSQKPLHMFTRHRHTD